MTEKISKLIKALNDNNMTASFVETKEEIVSEVKKYLKKGDTVACGGSVTLAQSGVIDLLGCGDYTFLDRNGKNLTAEERAKITKQAVFADVFFSSSNAVTMSGELVNVDGNSNRVSSIVFGPESVVIVVGVNKIVNDVNEGLLRVKKIAAPKNTKRLNCDTYCFNKGECINTDGKDFADGCKCAQRICCSYVVSSYQRVKGRIKVIICGEPLGY